MIFSWNQISQKLYQGRLSLHVWYSVKDVMSPKYLKSNNNSLHGWFVETTNRADCCFFSLCGWARFRASMIEVSVSGTDNILQFTSKSREQFAIVLDLFSGTEYCWLCGMRSLEHFLEGSAPLRLSLNGIVVPSVTKKSRQTAECSL